MACSSCPTCRLTGTGRGMVPSHLVPLQGPNEELAAVQPRGYWDRPPACNREYGDGGGDGSCTHPSGPVSPPVGLPGAGPLECRLSANRARIEAISLKVSQNQEVSPKCVHKACHSPHFQNRVQKSALQILRFPFCSAFSHKELIGPF